MSFEGSDEFIGRLKLPLPPRFKGKPQDCKEWSWTFEACLAMFDAHELDPTEVTNEDLAVTCYGSG